MRQIFLDRGLIVIKDVSQPLLDDYSVLVAVHYSFISSGTEVATMTNARASVFTNVPYKIRKVLETVTAHGIDATKALIKSKLQGDIQAIGYSCSGRVIAVGKQVRKFRTGDYVACAGASLANHADVVTVPETLAVRISDPSYLKAASLTTIGSIALQGMRRAQPQLGEHVCVIGLGLLGQLTVQLAKCSGCVVTGIDLLADRLALATKLGADHVYNALEENVQKEIEFVTQSQGVDATIITAASRSDAIMQQAMEITRKKGKVVLVGDVGLNLERNPFYKKEIDFLISCSYGPGRYDQLYEKKAQDYPYPYVRWTENRNMQAFVNLIESKQLNVDALISREVSLPDAAQAYENIKNKKELGVVLCYDVPVQQSSLLDYYGHQEQRSSTNPAPKKELRFIPAVKNSLRVGFVGAGGFAKVKLMPAVAKLRDVKINAIVDTDIANALNVSRLYNAQHSFVSDNELFADDLVDVVVIASPHKYHCDQALKALQQGKAVFVEKPMATDFEQFLRLRNFLREHSHMPFCVDYNRTFAPFIQKIKGVIQKRTSPLIIQYRMNAGLIPKEHWIQTDIGAGRIIGEACHIFDLFCYLTDAKPVAVSVEALHTSSDDIFPTDNFSTQISFDDGSICSLLYTSLGHADLGKERMELFFDAKSIVMDNYLRLHGFGLPNLFNEVVSAPDKGHESLIATFFSEMRKDRMVNPIPLDRLETVAELTLIIDRLACEGGGSKEFKSVLR